jgi:cell division protein FtsB
MNLMDMAMAQSAANPVVAQLQEQISKLTAENADLKKRVKELNEECEAQQYQFDILKKDPACVWANMLRGTIATPSALVEAHDYQQIKAENADLRAKLESGGEK